ncbi:MAG: hypothetical protein AB1589_00905 [Cyanobacteriota bacterium]
MPHQEALTVLAKIKPGETDNLKNLLGSIRENRKREPIIPFNQFNTIHFARLMILDQTEDLDGNIIQPQLAFLSNFDAPLDRHLQDLATIAGESFDLIFSHCEGYPALDERTPENRITYLRSHLVNSKPFYINTRGRTVQQIRQEAQLRDAIEEFLDSQDWSGRDVMEVRAVIQEFVLSNPDLSWAELPPEEPELSWRLKETLHKIGVPIVALLLSPIILVTLPIGLVLLRMNEEREVPDTSKADPEQIRRLRADEDFGVQNQIIAIGNFKGGWFRKITSRLVLELADYAIRHIYNQGSLSGLNTIHFARWVTLDEGRRLFFTSNYDGSLESYMNDFIDKAFWGLNAIFSNGDGFPKTRWLFFGGIQDEQAYKTFLPTRQIPTQVWYSAYENLSTVNIKNNEMIRRGLFGSMSRSDTEEWLRRF